MEINRPLILLPILLALGCATTSHGPMLYSDEAAIQRMRQIAILPFRHPRGPYYGEVCRHRFYSQFKKRTPHQIHIIEEKEIRRSLVNLFGDGDYDVTNDQGLAIAKSLGADTAVFGVCTPTDAKVYFLDVATGRITIDTGFSTFKQGGPRSLSQVNRVLVERLLKEFSCSTCTGTSSATAAGYAIPRSIAVLPVAGAAGRDGEVFREKAQKFIQDRGIRSISSKEVDDTLTSVFGSSDPAHLHDLEISSVTAALGVDAVIEVGISSVTEGRWSLAGIVIFPGPIPIVIPTHSSGQSYINILLYDKTSHWFRGVVPYGCLGGILDCREYGHFEDAWKQLPAWLQQ